MTKPIGIGVIGAGGIARRKHLPAYRALEAEGLVRVVALCDVDPVALREAATAFGVEHSFLDYRELLSLPEVVAVDVCTPNFLHRGPVIDALAAGKHVIVEKPLALNATEGAEMVAAARAAGRKLQVALNTRFGSGPQAVKRFIDDGRLGDIYHARAHALRRRGIPAHGVFTDKEKQGGGPLIDIGIHVLDLALWFMGYPRPLTVSGQAHAKFGTRSGLVGLRGQWDPARFTVEDFAAAFVRFENGASLSLETSFAANIERDGFAIHLLGTEGGAVVDPFDPNQIRILREECGSLTDTTLPFPPAVDSVEAELRAFVRCILDDTQPLVSGEQGLLVSRIVDGIYLSSETRAEVHIENSGEVENRERFRA